MLLVQHCSATHFSQRAKQHKKFKLALERLKRIFLVKGEGSGKERSRDVKYTILHDSKGKSAEKEK